MGQRVPWGEPARRARSSHRKRLAIRVFVTGATGFIGSAVVRELVGAGHHVTGLARSAASAARLGELGAEVMRGSIEDLPGLARAASAAEGVVHTAFYHQITHMTLGTRLRVIAGGTPSGIVRRFVGAAVTADRRAIETIGAALRGSNKPFVTTFGTLAMEPGRLALEDRAYDKGSVGAPRATSEDTVRGLASTGVRATLLRLPPIVHGPGDRNGFVPQLAKIARKAGFSIYVGDGLNRWAAVHQRDVARLYRLALEKGTAGAVYHGSAEEGTPFRTIAEVIGRRVGVPAVSKSPREAAKQLGFFQLFVPVDNPVSSKLTQERLGWAPREIGLLADLEGPDYSAI